MTTKKSMFNEHEAHNEDAQILVQRVDAQFRTWFALYVDEYGYSVRDVEAVIAGALQTVACECRLMRVLDRHKTGA